jgi:hypothetical protein
LVTETNFSVCVSLCALAAAGSASTPAVPATTVAAPIAASDVRSFMMDSPVCGAWFRQERRYEFGAAQSSCAGMT